MSNREQPIETRPLPQPITPDLIVLRSNEQWDMNGEINEWVRELGCDPDQFEARHIADVTVADVLNKVVCGEIPLWMAQHAKLVIVREPAGDHHQMPDYSVTDAAFELSNRLTAFRIHRAASQPAT